MENKPDRLEGTLELAKSGGRDDLRRLHDLPRGRVERSHVVDDIAVPDDGEQTLRHVGTTTIDKVFRMSSNVLETENETEITR